MPTYSYYCFPCAEKKDRIAKIAERDEQRCNNCGSELLRGIDKPALVWAPTAGGMRT